MKLAVIPARGGSKRIPRKNIKNFSGKPMIAWSIEAAKASGCFDHIIVSTDDMEIKKIAEQYGAEIPFIRPAELSDDHTPTMPVINHAINWWTENYKKPDYVCCIYATAPFILPEDLQEGLEDLQNSDSSYAFPITSFPFPIQRAVKKRADGKLEMFSPEHMMTRSQDLEEAYHDVGQFYWGHTDSWLKEKSVFTDATPVIIPRWRAQDIDTMEDWERAEALFLNMSTFKAAA